MQFLFQPLTWGFFLVSLPVLIHLINLMRHRRVKWAAMDFLLRSYKKNRRWVWLKQFLLLLARMLAIAAAVAMLAQLVSRDQWPSLSGGQIFHHLVLLDDSLSMSDQTPAGTAFLNAQTALRRIADIAERRPHESHKLTLIRYSRADLAARNMVASAGATGAEMSSDPAAEILAAGAAADPPTGDLASEETQPVNEVNADIIDLNGAFIDSEFDLTLEKLRQQFAVTELSCQPAAALELASAVIQATPNERHALYIVSDFRRAAWEDPIDIRQQLTALKGVDVHLIRAVEQPHANLGLTELAPARANQAAGVPFFVELAITNYGDEPANRVPVQVTTQSFPTANISLTSAPEVAELPALIVDSIASGETVRQRVQVYFASPGQHVVTAQLPTDAVLADNLRRTVVDVPAEISILAIDGDLGQSAYFLQSVFEPSQRAPTGIHARIEPTSYLRDVAAEELSNFRAVYLLSVDRLDDAATSKLDEFVRAGGGLIIFLGPDSQTDFYAGWHRDGDGLFPAELAGQDVLIPDLETPDIEFSDHPVFRVLLGERNPFARGMRVNQYFRVAADWQPSQASGSRVVARLRNGVPLAIERRFGEGRVMVFTTTLAPVWNNWARLPSFVVTTLELNVYVSRDAPQNRSLLVGSPIDLSLAEGEFRPEIQFRLPPSDNQVRLVQRTAQKEAAGVWQVSLGRSLDPFSVSVDTIGSGIYEAFPTAVDGRLSVRRYALNIDPAESDLTLVSDARLTDMFRDQAVFVHSMDDFSSDVTRDARFSWSPLLMYGLLALLIGEQLLAYSASYHPLPAGGP